MRHKKEAFFDILRIVDLVVYLAEFGSIQGKYCMRKYLEYEFFSLESVLLNGYQTALNVSCLRKLYAKF